VATIYLVMIPILQLMNRIDIAMEANSTLLMNFWYYVLRQRSSCKMNRGIFDLRKRRDALLLMRNGQEDDQEIGNGVADTTKYHPRASSSSHRRGSHLHIAPW
jgi:hypothetical protein